MSLDSIVDVSITTLTTTPTRAGFGTPCLISYFPTTVTPDRVREYGSLSEMTTAGHKTSDAAYLMAVALKSQNPSAKTWKVGRKALASVQTVRITPTITTEGEVLTLTVEGTEVSYTILAAASVASIVTAMTALFAAIPGVTASDDTTHITLTPKNVLSATLTVNGVANTETYTVTIDGTAYAFLSDGTATATEIRDGLQALIIAGGLTAAAVIDNAADALDFDFTLDSDITHEGADLRESATGAATMVLSSEVLANRLLSIGGATTGLTIKDLTPDPGIATDWAAIIAEDPDFYGVGLDSESEAETKALAALVETQRMLYIAGTIDTENKDSGTTDDVMSELASLNYARTGTLQAEYNSQYAGMRWMGKMFPKDPGSATWAYKTLAGLTTSVMTAGEKSAIDGKTGNRYTDVGGASITQKGYSASGEFLDITRGVDWFQARLQERIYALLINLDKITYAEAGDLFRAEILAQLGEGEKRGVIAPDVEATPWVVTIPEVEDIPTADKALRNFPAIEFSAFLAGAVHTIEISGTLSL